MLEIKGRKYQQVQSLRDITNSNFPNGQIRFNWSVPAQESWNPYLSFFTVRYNLSSWKKRLRPGVSTSGDVNIDPSVEIAPTMFFNDSLWQTMEMQINGITINKQDNYVHQIAALKYRMQTETMNKQMYKLNFPEISLEERAQKMGPGGYGDNIAEVGPKDLFDILGSTPTIISTLVGPGGGACTITFANAGIIGVNLSEIFNIGDVIHVRFTRDDTNANALITFTDGPITAITATTITFTSRLGGKKEEANAVALAAGDILFSGKLTKGKSKAPKYRYVETIWKPKLDFFDVNQWLPGGEYEIILTPYPESSYKRQAIQVGYNTYANFFIDSNMSIVNMELNVCSCAQPGDVKSIAFNETRCQAKTLNTTSLSQKQFNIHPNTKIMAIAYQDNRVNSDWRICGSKFKIIDNIDNAALRDENWEQKLQRFYIQYDGEVLPNPIPDMRKDADQDFLYQRYWETQQYKLMQYDDIETYEEWKERGPYYLFCWPRRNKNAVELQVSQEFSGLLPNGLSPQLLLFEMYLQKYEFNLSNGYITSVKKVL